MLFGKHIIVMGVIPKYAAILHLLRCIKDWVIFTKIAGTYASDKCKYNVGVAFGWEMGVVC